MDLLENSLSMLGKRVTDRVTGFAGMCSSVNFDAYGCVQILVSPSVDKDGKLVDSVWFDVKRMEVSETRVMPAPNFSQTKFGEENGSNRLPSLRI